MKHCTCAVMAAALTFAACQGDHRSASLPAIDSPRVAESVGDSLRLMMVLPARVSAGDDVAITLRATNESGRTLELYLQGREPTADVVVRTSSNAVVWHRLGGVAVPGILRLEPLAAGATLSVHVSWTQVGDDGAHVAPGVYQVAARLLGERPDALQFPPAWIEILP